MRRSLILARFALLSGGLAGLVACASSDDAEAADTAWRLIDKLEGNVVVLGADGDIGEREEAWIGERETTRLRPVGPVACPSMENGISARPINPAMVDVALEGLIEPDWFHGAEAGALGMRFHRFGHQCGDVFPAEEYWFANLTEAQHFAEETRVDVFLGSRWILIAERPEFQVFVRPEDAGRTMGWSFVLPTSYDREAYASFGLADCQNGKMADGGLINFSGGDIEHTGNSYPLRLWPLDPTRSDTELLEWFCTERPPSDGETLSELFAASN